MCGPWLPASLLTGHGLSPTKINKLSYLVVDERVGPYFSVSIEPWPQVDDWGRLRFPRRDECGHVVLHRSQLTRELYTGLRERPPRIGDVFAGTLAPEAQEFVRSEEEFDWEHRISDLITGTVYDVTEDARRALKIAYYAALVRPLTQEVADRRKQMTHLEEGAQTAPAKHTKPAGKGR